MVPSSTSARTESQPTSQPTSSPECARRSAASRAVMHLLRAGVLASLAAGCSSSSGSPVASSDPDVVGDTSSTTTTNTPATTLPAIAAPATVTTSLPPVSATTAPATCPADEPHETLTVAAASSMTAVFAAVEPVFLATHPCVDDVRFTYGSSTVLATQVVNGSPVGVFVSASQGAMDIVTKAGLGRGAPVLFARNKAAIMVAPGSRFASSMSGLPDLLDERNPGIKVGLCVASAPCGSLANTVLANAAKALAVPSLTRARVADTEAASVEDLVTKVQLGELDAGITYVSDCVTATAARLATCVPITDSTDGVAVNAANSYLAVRLDDSPAARGFVRFMQSSSMITTLISDFGFLSP